MNLDRLKEIFAKGNECVEAITVVSEDPEIGKTLDAEVISKMFACLMVTALVEVFAEHMGVSPVNAIEVMKQTQF